MNFAENINFINFRELSKALREVLNEIVLSKVISNVNLIYCESSNKYDVSDFRNEVLSISSSIVVQQESCNLISESDSVRRTKFRIFIADNFESFMKFHKHTNENTFRTEAFYLIIFLNKESFESDRIFEFFWRLQILNVNIMLEDMESKIVVKTFFPFQPGNCNNTTATVINEFRFGKFVNDIKYFFPNKLKNLNKCQVRVSTRHNNKPMTFAQCHPNGTFYNFAGRDIKLTLQ